MKIQGATPNYNVRGLPQVSGGPTATADSFGAGAARQVGQLGQAAQGFGQEVINQDQVRRKKEDEVFTRNAVNDAHKRFADQRQTLYSQYRGQNAVKAPEEVDKLFCQIRESISAGLQNQHQKDAFAKSMDAMEKQIHTEVFAYRDRQIKVARRQGLDAQNEIIMQKAVASAAGALTPDGQAANHGRIEQIRDNIRMRYRGAPVEMVDLVAQRAEQTFHNSLISAMERPEDVLRYLGHNEVQNAFGPALTTAMKKKWQAVYESKIIRNTTDAAVSEASIRIRSGEDINAVRLDMFDKLGMDGFKSAKAELMDLADAVDKVKSSQEAEKREDAARDVLASLPEKPTDADLTEAKAGWVAAGGDAKIFDSIVQGPRLQLDAENKRIAQTNLEHTQKLDQEFEQASGDPRAMASWSSMTLAEQDAYLKKQAGYQKNGVYGLPDERTRYMTFREFENLPPEERNELLADPEKSWVLVEKLGGSDSIYGKKIAAMTTGNEKPPKYDTPPQTASDVAVRMGKTTKDTIKTALDLQLASPEARLVMNSDDVKFFRLNAEHKINEDVLSYMKRKNLVLPDDVPHEEIISIIARNSVVYAQPGSVASDKEKMPTFPSAALAATGTVPDGYQVDMPSLPVAYKKNLLGDSTPVMRTRADGGRAYIQTNVQQRDLPEPVRQLVETMPATLLNAEVDLGTGAIKLEFPNHYIGVTSTGKQVAYQHKSEEERQSMRSRYAAFRDARGGSGF